MADTFPDQAIVESQGFSSVRLIKAIQDNDMLITVWGAKDNGDGICLIAGIPDGVFASQCVPPKVFTEQGVSLGFNGLEVSWDGVATSVTLPMSASKN